MVLIFRLADPPGRGLAVGIVFDLRGLTGRQVRPERGPGGAVLPLGALLADFPVVLLEGADGGGA